MLDPLFSLKVASNIGIRLSGRL